MAQANNRLHTDAALRASANGRLGFARFSSQQWFQADDRAARVKRTLDHYATEIVWMQYRT